MAKKLSKAEQLKLLQQALDACKVMFASKKARKSLPSGMSMALDAMEGAVQDHASKADTDALFRAATEEERAEAAGMLNLLEQVVVGVRDVLTNVGGELGDSHVEAVGCGDPNCPNCGGAAIPSGVKEKIAKALGLSPDKVDVVAASSLGEALKTLGPVENGELVFRANDPHTQDIVDTLAKMKKRITLPPRKIPES